MLYCAANTRVKIEKQSICSAASTAIDAAGNYVSDLLAGAAADTAAARCTATLEPSFATNCLKM